MCIFVPIQLSKYNVYDIDFGETNIHLVYWKSFTLNTLINDFYSVHQQQ